MSLTFLLILASSLAMGSSESSINSVTNNKVNEDTVGTLDWQVSETIASQFPYYLSGYDYENRPVIVCEFGGWDTRSVVEKKGQNVMELDKLVDQFVERMRTGFFNRKRGETESESEENDNELVLIIDFEGLRLRQLRSADNVQFLMKMFAKLEKAADQIAYGFIINANSLVEHLINVSKPVMGRLLEKLEVYGTKASTWKHLMSRKISLNQLHAAYGGNKDFRPVAIYG